MNTIPPLPAAGTTPSSSNHAIPLAEQSAVSTPLPATASTAPATNNDRLQISAGARALANNLNAENIARATETNESAVKEASESAQRQVQENEQIKLTAEQPKVNPATQKTITTRIDVVA